jgi:hypothetical protein
MLHFEVEKTNPWGIIIIIIFFFEIFFEISICIFFWYPRIPSRRSRKPTNKKHVALCSSQRELCTSLVRHLTHIRHLGKKIRGPELGTEYHFTRNSFFHQDWRLRAHHFFTPLWKKRQVFDTTVTEIGKNRWNIERHPPPSWHDVRGKPRGATPYDMCTSSLYSGFSKGPLQLEDSALSPPPPPADQSCG